jgi:hypothetical protein
MKPLQKWGVWGFPQKIFEKLRKKLLFFKLIGDIFRRVSKVGLWGWDFLYQILISGYRALALFKLIMTPPNTPNMVLADSILKTAPMVQSVGIRHKSYIGDYKAAQSCLFTTRAHHS